MLGASEGLSKEQAAAAHAQFLMAREAAIIDEIRSVCGVSVHAESGQDTDLDDLAADIDADGGLDPEEELEAV